MTADKPPPFMPKLRFPEFAQSPGWDHAMVADLVETVTPPKKLTTSTYLAGGRFPIIDQSQSYICGWTNDDEAVITKPLPVIVFGDHTCVLKFVNRPFAQGADGIKILTARRRVSTLYLYHQLTYRPVVMEEYKRHFSVLKDKVVCFPDPKSGEQQKIADCLGSLDDLITAETQKLEALRKHKQGLMQQLLPQSGETVPRLRFPEFEDTPEWKEERLGNLVAIVSGKSPSQYALFAQGNCAFVKVEDLNNCSKYQVDAREYCNDVQDAVPSGSILFPKRGAAIENNKIRITASEILIDTNLMALMPCNTAATEFLYYYLVRVGLAQIADTSSIPQINNKHIIPYRVLVPSESEQHRIADCLSMLDARLATQVQKLDALKTHKQGLLQLLFPPLESQ